MSQLGRSAGLTGFVEVTRGAGLDPYRLAVRAGVPRAALTHPDMMVSLPAMSALIEAGAKASGIEDFGLRMAAHRRLATMGPLGLAVRQQTSLRGAFDVLIRYGWSYNEGLSLALSDGEEVSVLRVGHAFWRGRATTDLVAASMFRVAQGLRGPGWRPLEVRFMHAAPANPEPYRRFFGIAPLFDQDFIGVVMNRADLDAVIPGADPAMADEAIRYLERVTQMRSPELKTRVRDLLSAQLTDGACSVERIAEQLGVDRRTLHRRLASEGASYSEILADVRRELARSLLATSDRPLSDVADALGFSSLSVFAHWFRRNFGCTASAFRARTAGQGGGVADGLALV